MRQQTRALSNTRSRKGLPTTKHNIRITTPLHKQHTTARIHMNTQPRRISPSQAVTFQSVSQKNDINRMQISSTWFALSSIAFIVPHADMHLMQSAGI
jgi:hypothetical protein